MPAQGWILNKYLFRFMYFKFPVLVKYYHILFIIIVFRLGSHKLLSCFFYCLSLGISHGM